MVQEKIVDSICCTSDVFIYAFDYMIIMIAYSSV